MNGMSDIPQIINIADDSKFVPYQRMANAIIFLTQKFGGCIPGDLLALGFSKQDAEERWHMAQAMAAVELRLMRKAICSVDICEVHYA